MYELIRAGERSWYIDCPAKIGICLLDGADVCLIDSGNDRDAGKRALRTLEVLCIVFSHACFCPDVHPIIIDRFTSDVSTG